MRGPERGGDPHGAGAGAGRREDRGDDAEREVEVQHRGGSGLLPRRRGRQDKIQAGERRLRQEESEVNKEHNFVEVHI